MCKVKTFMDISGSDIYNIGYMKSAYTKWEDKNVKRFILNFIKEKQESDERVNELYRRVKRACRVY